MVLENQELIISITFIDTDKRILGSFIRFNRRRYNISPFDQSTIYGSYNFH